MKEIKDPAFLKIGVHLGMLLNKTKWYQFRKRKLLTKGIIASYLDYTGRHKLADKLLSN